MTLLQFSLLLGDASTETFFLTEIITMLTSSDMIVLLLMVLFYIFIQYYAVLKEISIR